jgi:hypothetical protein
MKIYEFLGMMDVSTIPVLSASSVIVWIGDGLNFTKFRNFGHKLPPYNGCKFGIIRPRELNQSALDNRFQWYASGLIMGGGGGM